MSTSLYRTGNVVELSIYTKPNTQLGTYNGWATIGLIPPEKTKFIPAHAVIKRFIVSPSVSGIMKINTDGAIGIGFTYNTTSTVACDLDKDTEIIFDTIYIAD